MSCKSHVYYTQTDLGKSFGNKARRLAAGLVHSRPLTLEAGDQLQMTGPGELVDRRDLDESEATVDQGPGVAREAVGVARDRDRRRHRRAGDLGGLLAGAGARQTCRASSCCAPVIR